MSIMFRGAALFAALGMAAWGQEGRKPDDVLQKKDGSILVGRILKLDAEQLEILLTDEKEPRKIDLKELNPYSVYRIRLDRIDKQNGQAHMDLAEHCMANGLYTTAVKEYDEAARLDKGLEEKAKMHRAEAHNEDGRAKFEESKKLAAERKYDEANKICQMLIEKYTDTPYFEEARKLVARIADDVAKENETRKKMIEDRKDQKAKAVEAVRETQEKDLFGRTTELIEEARKLWIEGLEHEPKNLTRADRAWKSGEGALLAARRNVEFLLKSGDVEMIKKAREAEKQIDATLVKTCYRLGRMWAVEGSYPTALEWLNKLMKIPHDELMDRMVNELLLTMSQLKMRERAAGKGF